METRLTSMQNLFEEKTRTDTDPAFYSENVYEYYDRSARVDAAKIRQVLNEWFRFYPSIEQHELFCRIKKTFSDAFYELFIHELFRSQGFLLKVHPEIPNSTKRPDFLVSKENFEFYLEAKESKDKTQTQKALENRENQFYDSINKIKSPNFFLRIEELIIKSEKQPATKGLIARIEEALTKYDPDEVQEQIKVSGFDNIPKIIQEDPDLKFIVSLIPKSPTLRKVDAGRPIGMHPIQAFIGGSEDSIKTSFIKKAKRYGKLDKPYIICINAIGPKFIGPYDVENAIWGTLALAWTDDPINSKERLVRANDGIFFGLKGPKFQNVNGVLVTNIWPHNVPVSSYWFAKHPFSRKDFSFDIFMLEYFYAENGQIKKKEGRSFGEILNIDANWLERS